MRPSKVSEDEQKSRRKKFSGEKISAGLFVDPFEPAGEIPGVARDLLFPAAEILSTRERMRRGVDEYVSLSNQPALTLRVPILTFV